LFAIWKDCDTTESFTNWLDHLERGEEIAGSEQALQKVAGAFKDGKLDAGKVAYLDEEERKQYLAKCNGKAITSDGVTGQPAQLIFVVSPSGELYVGEKDREKFHHSSFLAGGPVKAAGTLLMEGGSLVAISDLSGHYTPSPEMVKAAIKTLESRGVPMESVGVKLGRKVVDYYTFMGLSAPTEEDDNWELISHGPIGREKAEWLLIGRPKGTWMARAGTSEQNVVSLFDGETIRHFAQTDQSEKLSRSLACKQFGESFRLAPGAEVLIRPIRTEKAEEKLPNSGDWLIRWSKSGKGYVVSVRTPEGVDHIPVKDHSPRQLLKTYGANRLVAG
jgi:hypothetical protein